MSSVSLIPYTTIGVRRIQPALLDRLLVQELDPDGEVLVTTGATEAIAARGGDADLIDLTVVDDARAGGTVAPG